MLLFFTVLSFEGLFEHAFCCFSFNREKKWAPSARSKTFQVHKWVKSDRTIVFEDDDDDQDMSATDRVNKEGETGKGAIKRVNWAFGANTIEIS
ncbi:hypothetical protein BC940DRAFT_290700 [Gongronella butleri]|nr:hypothetical protein BC940DRAFT_290700 [Gongronella butleri]